MKVSSVNQAPISSYNQQIRQAANMSNDEIIKQSCESGNVAAEKKPAGKLLKALPVLAVAGVAAVNGLATKGKLSNKVKNIACTLGTFAVISGIYDGVQAGINKIEEKSTLVKDTQEKAPLLTTIGKLGASFGISALALKGAEKGVKKLVKRFPKTTKEFQDMSKVVAEFIDKSKLSKVSDSVVNALKTVAGKYPKLSKFAKNNSFAIMVVGYVGLTALLGMKAQKDRQKAAYSKAEELSTRRQQAQIAIDKANELKTSNV